MVSGKSVRRGLKSSLFLLVSLLYMPIGYSSAISSAQIQTMNQGVLYFNVDSSSACGASGTTALIGADNPTKVWNFFKGKGLDDMHVAAIMGSLQQEAGFNPTRVEGNAKHPELPRTSTDPAGLPVVDGWYGGQTRQPGWGIVQWTPSGKVIAKASENNITGNIAELSTQLQLVWAEMSGTSPTGVKKMLDGFKTTTTIEQATSYFTTNYEGAGVVGPRLQLAQAALAQYQGTGSTSDGSNSISCGYLPPDCTSASGVDKILCAAKAYDPVSYFEGTAGGHQGGAAWHASCSTINASCVLDCSGLLNISLYDVTGGLVDRRGAVADIPNEPQSWQEVSFDQLQPGDILVVLRSSGSNHVEIVDHKQGQTIYTFGSHAADRPQEAQVGPSSYSNSSEYTYYHYIGPGV